MAHMVEHVAPHRHEKLVALGNEWTRLDSRARDLRALTSGQIALDWIVRRQAAIREMMIETSAAEFWRIQLRSHSSSPHRPVEYT